ncbi:MAG: glycoside hydrolase family 16 protein [Cryomorphaceae bacterium]
MKSFLPITFLTGILLGCASVEEQRPVPEVISSPVDLSSTVRFTDHPALNDSAPLPFTLDIIETGRYRVTVFGTECAGCEVWIEDYVGNPDGRTYNITGSIDLSNGRASKDGSPMAAGEHALAVHANADVNIDSIHFERMVRHGATPEQLTQSMKGEEWELVWSDEFDGEGLPDSTKWTYNVGNWGWGNNEPQYYTHARLENARQENGTLIIEARKDDMGQPWTSARLTTQGKTAFTYGRIEFRAKVPEGEGTWAAGWLLGDAYRDELSWPYCGEIDVLECVGYEIDDETGTGLNHATCHTRAYYFKQGNQIGSEIQVDSMNSVFHTYAIEWYPDVIKGYLDGEHYYTYDKTADSLEWPFHEAQNIVLNLAVGGGWGGMKGIDPSYDRHAYVLDYVRVYQKK